MNIIPLFKFRFFTDKNGNKKVELENKYGEKGVFDESFLPENKTGLKEGIADFIETEVYDPNFSILNTRGSKDDKNISFLKNHLGANDGKPHFYNVEYTKSIDGKCLLEEFIKSEWERYNSTRLVVSAKVYDMEKNINIALNLLEWVDSLPWKEQDKFYQQVHERRNCKLTL